MSTVTAELAGVYLDDITDAATSGLLVANEVPERDASEGHKEKQIDLEILCTNGSFVDQANTDIYVDGVLALSSGAGANGWSAVVSSCLSAVSVTDGDMEAVGTAAWTPVNSPTLTKETSDPYEGAKNLRIQGTGTADPGVSQACLTVGKTYYIEAAIRCDGGTVPVVDFGTQRALGGTSSPASWTIMSGVATCAGSGDLILQSSDRFGTGWSEFDYIRIWEVSSTDLSVSLSRSGEQWDSQATVTVRVVSQDFAATDTVDYTYTFTVEDYVAPTVVSASAPGPSVVRVVFSEGMKAFSASGSDDALNPSLYTLTYQQDSANIAAVSASVESVSQVSATTYDISTDIPLTFGKTYLVEAIGVADDSVAGNVTAAPDADATFTAWTPPSWPSRRSFDFYSMFSDHDRTQDTSGDLESICSVLQDVIDIMLWQIDSYPDIWDVDDAPIEHVRAMLEDLGNPFNLDITETQERKLLELLVPIYQQKGTEQGIINLARFFAGLEITDIVPALEETWILGDTEMGLLGETTVLAPSNAAARYTFQVIVDRALTASETTILDEIIRKMKCAHEHSFIVEPTEPDHIDHWELGLSYIGESTYLH